MSSDGSTAEMPPAPPNVGAIDRFQRETPIVGFPIAVVYKFFDDQGTYLAATMTYYAFIAIFPLMLLGTSILGFFLQGNEELQQQILNSALSQFPIIGDELGRPSGLQGSLTGVIFGALAALYGCMGLGQSLQNTTHIVWSVPRNSRPNPFHSRFKTLVLLLSAGTALLAVSVLSTIVASTDWFQRWLGDGLTFVVPILSTLVVGASLTFLFRFASAGRPSYWVTMPGGFALALMWQGLQYGGAAYVEHVLVGAQSMTNTFALVLGLVGFLWIAAVMAVIAMEINVVLARRLWPRALLTPFTDNVVLTDADMRAYQAYAQMQRHKGFEQVSVRFEKWTEAAEAEEEAEEAEAEAAAADAAGAAGAAAVPAAAESGSTADVERAPGAP